MVREVPPIWAPGHAATVIRRLERDVFPWLGGRPDAALPLEGIGRFAVIYADPPWPYDVNVTENWDISVNDYPTLTLDEFAALPVDNIAYMDAVLFLWASLAMTRKAVCVIEAWGFTLQSSIAWDKERVGPLRLVCNTSTVPTSAVGREALIRTHDIEQRWFDYWLKGIDTGIKKETPCPDLRDGR